MRRQVTLTRQCFKIEKENAEAMIYGFKKDGKIIHQAIYCVTENKKFPMLITPHRSPLTTYLLSQTGKCLKGKSFNMPYRYIVKSGEEYFIKNDNELWKILCSNDLFDIWDSSAPKKRFEDKSAKPPSSYRIVLLRIYEILEEFDKDEINTNSDYVDYIERENLDVTLVKPVIDEEEFQRIKNLLEESIKNYQQNSDARGIKNA